jgi:hypothetical protein
MKEGRLETKKKRVTLRLSLKVAVYSSCQRSHHDKADREEKKSEGEGKKKQRKELAGKKSYLQVLFKLRSCGVW